MRLYKKAAVCLLAAAMALSMLTACGGGGGTPTKPADSKPGTSAGGEEKPGTAEDGKGDSSKGDSSDASGGALSWETSKAYKYSKKFESSNLQMDIEYKLLQTSDQNQIANVGKVCKILYAQAGEQTYVKYSLEKEAGRYLFLTDKQYILNDAEKTCVITQRSSSGSSTGGMLMPVQALPQKPICGTTVIDGTEYNTEKYTAKVKNDGVVYTYTIIDCFDQQDDLVYVVYEGTKSSGEVQKYQIKYNSVSNNVNAELFKVPEIPADYDVVDFTNME